MLGNRIFRDDGCAVIVPIDHGLSGVVPGWENPGETLTKIMAGKPDAVMTTYGNLKRFRHLLEGKAAMLMRLDSGNSPFVKENLDVWALLYTVEDAVRMGCAGVLLNGMFGTLCDMDSIQIIADVACECDKAGLMLAVETFPLPGSTVPKEELLSPKHVATACRVAYELGADCIKTLYTNSVQSFKQVVASCPIPVMIAGGAKMDTEREVLETVAGMLAAGGKGTWFGRNTWQHKDPTAMVRALMDVVHEGASVADALKEFKKK
jgi:DhnA family fructose-bisphosphate aldolase class Ia